MAQNKHHDKKEESKNEHHKGEKEHAKKPETEQGKGWGGKVDVPSSKDEDPQKNFTPVLGQEYLEVGPEDIASYHEEDKAAKKKQVEDKERDTKQLEKDRKGLLEREGH